MNNIVGDVGGFEAKLNEMVKQNYLSPNQRNMLATVVDAGSAAAHRGFKPERTLLEEMLATMESVIRDHYVTGPALRRMQALVPPRPPRRRAPDA
jgi:hypothetical protein